ncbi:nucleotidyltransferase family protein [uncultured Methanospirillum sp.]|uniref:nucleotidyltransferase domain-containing protein n=1 Tax=uncultured Methanospirillum sp. TaxID=262503 RepID=UPI0029C9AC5B|nr:nucleotidyltransferase family protein [uncultured Methanospirillum sp.]
MIPLSHIFEDGNSFFELIQLLSPDHFRRDSIPDDHWPQIISCADRMRVIPLLCYILKQYDGIQLPTEISHTLMARYLANGGRNLMLSSELKRILNAFDTNAMQVVPLKGAYLAYAVYERSSMRQMLDLDLMVKWEDMPKAITILETLGYIATGAFHWDEECRRFDHHGPGYRHPSGSMVELHWNIIDAHSIGEREIAIGEIFLLRARPGFLLETKTYLLTPEDLILHSVIHQTLHHIFHLGIREFYDIKQIYEKFHDNINWGLLISSAKELKIERPVILILTLTDLITGSDITKKMSREGFTCEIPDQYLIAALSEIEQENSACSVSFRLSHSKKGILGLIYPALNRVFLSRKSMQMKYQVPSDSLRIYLCYPHRLFYLICHFGPNLINEYFSSHENGNKHFWNWLYGG